MESLENLAGHIWEPLTSVESNLFETSEKLITLMLVSECYFILNVDILRNIWYWYAPDTYVEHIEIFSPVQGYRCRILIWASLLQQEYNPAATENVNYYVDYN